MEEHSELSMEPLSAARMATNPLTEKSKAALRKSRPMTCDKCTPS